MINKLQTLTLLGHKQQQPFSGHTPTRTNKRIQTLTHLGHNQQQSFSGLHQPLELINRPITNTDSPGSQPTTALLRSTPTRMINKLQTLPYLGHNQQQPFLGLHQPGRLANCKHWLTCVTTNNSPSQDYTNPDDQPTTNADSPVSQLTTVLFRTTPTRTISQLQTSILLGHNQQQPFSGLHQHRRSANYKYWLTCVITSNSSSQDYTNTDDQPTTNIDSPWSKPTMVLLRTTSTGMISQLQTSIHLGHNQQQSFSELHQPGQSSYSKHWQTWVKTNNIPSQDYTNADDQSSTNIKLTWVTTKNSPSQDYTNPDDQRTTKIDSPWSQQTTVLLRTTPTWTVKQLQTLTHLRHNKQQPFSWLHWPGRSANYKHWLTCVTSNNSPSQDYTNSDDQRTTKIDSPGL